MSDETEAATERLKTWMRDYGDTKSPAFLNDLQQVLSAVRFVREQAVQHGYAEWVTDDAGNTEWRWVEGER